jgi:broad specificity phosphatase PhoE
MTGPQIPRNRSLNPRARRALELLAGDQRGATEALLLAHGFTLRMLVGLIRAGLATAEREMMKAGAKPSELVRVRITDDGRKALKD